MAIKSWQVISSIVLITSIAVVIQIPSNTWATAATASLILGASALACMATSCILASRWHSIEWLFGGLDRVYETHKWIGIWALVFAAYHLVFKAELDAWELASILELPKYWTRLVRQLSFVVLGLIILLALNRKIPYGNWRWLHKFSGPLFLIVILHWLSIESPITLTSPAGIWLALLCTVGVIAALYKLLYPFIAKSGEYKLSTVSHGKAAVHLEFEPVRNGFVFEAGQFAFISLKAAGLHEPHPFTIANAYSDNGHIHFVIRELGDYTKKLSKKVKVGMLADIYAPYGNFKRQPSAKREIWIGAGVGISPFISWLEDKTIGHFERATLVYCFDPARAFPSAEHMQEMTVQSGAEFVANPSGSEALAETIRQATSEVDPKDVQISFCGPEGLLQKVQELMKENSIPTNNIHYEFFDFR
ncbi:ferric reductase-like transmembrane domain-containing protein [Psychrobacter sp. 72-O-c]|uniref:ferredoxin reductase family protein n=1 Tax=Psychrobacter sp. 72-O-c TaxID=2774125 RepID=UPI00191A1029|nr:ferredoxin reductase family protein [Psychrobacter sp. 72-O-c]